MEFGGENESCPGFVRTIALLLHKQGQFHSKCYIFKKLKGFTASQRRSLGELALVGLCCENCRLQNSELPGVYSDPLLPNEQLLMGSVLLDQLFGLVCSIFGLVFFPF